MSTVSQLEEKGPLVFEKYPDIGAVFLFGSLADNPRLKPARGREFGPDLDLGVYSLKKKSDYRLDLLTDISNMGFDHIDLVFLHEAGFVLRHEIVRRRYLIFRRPAFDLGGYFSLVTRQYLDFKPYLEVQRRALKKRIQAVKNG